MTAKILENNLISLIEQRQLNSQLTIEYVNIYCDILDNAKGYNK